MMKKPDFTTAQTGRALATEITKATAKKRNPTEGQTEIRKSAGRKVIRINIAFTPENHDYIKLMAVVAGMSVTEFVNSMIEKERKSSPYYEKARALREMYYNDGGHNDGESDTKEQQE